MIISLTGCDPNRDFTKTCKEVNKTPGYEERIQTKINYNNKDEVTDVTIEKVYNIDDKEILESIKKSSTEFNNNLKNTKGVSFETTNEDKKYVVTYHLNAPKMNEESLELFSVKKNSIKYFNYLKSNDIECS